MGNHNKAKVLGKGTVEVKMSSGKMMILRNVFHVPDIKKNLVSINFLCKSGVKAILESDNSVGGKYCLRKMILCLKVIYFLFVFCVNIVIPLLLCVLFPTHLTSLKNRKKKFSYDRPKM